MRINLIKGKELQIKERSYRLMEGHEG